MRIQDRITIFAGNTQSGGQTDKTNKAKGDTSGRQGKALFVGNLQGDFSLEDRIRRKQEKARRQALKAICEAWDGDRKIDEELDKSRGRVKDLQQSNRDMMGELGDIAKEREALKASYGIGEDSQEEAELKLLRRGREALENPSSEGLTEDEWEQYKKIQEGGLSDYQSRQLELDGQERIRREIIDKNNLEIQCENAVIRGIRHERLKRNPMLEAGKEAESIMDGVREEIIGMVVDDAKEHIDEKQEERQEQAEALREKKEEQEEILEERRQRAEEQEDIMEDMSVEQMADINKTQDEIRQEVQKIVDKMGLVAEDIKGSMVDANV